MTAAPPADTRSTVGAARLHVEAALRKGDRGRAALQPYITVVEDVVCRAFDDAFRGIGGCALLAVGGLARRSLCPFADVDVWVLLDDERDMAQLSAAEAFVQAGWDAGLHMATAVGDANALSRRCVDDDQAATALLEARPLAGDDATSQRFLRHFRRRLVPKHRQVWMQAKLDERMLRRRREGSRVQCLEPHLKNAPGALRDLHTALWLYLLRHPVDVGDDAVGALLRRGLLHHREAAELREGERTLLSLRAALHIIRGRNDDRLSFEVLDDIAAMLDVDALGDLSGMERAMRAYYEAALGIARTSDILIDRLHSEQALKASAIFRFKDYVESRRPRRWEGTFASSGRLHLQHPNAVEQSLPLMIDTVRIGAEQGLPLAARTKATLLTGVHRMQQARRNGHDDKATGDALARLCASDRVQGAPFTELLELGVLPLAMRDLQRLYCRFKADGYHALSTDAHLAHCADLALQVVSGVFVLNNTLDAIRQRTPGLHRLVWSALFHDLGKGLDGDHAQVGVDLLHVEEERLPLSPADVRDIAFVVKEHLVLSHASQRRDLADPGVIHDLADVVRSQDRLDLLTLLTVVDIAAVAPNMLTDWKAQLLGRANVKVTAALRSTAAHPSTAHLAGQDADDARAGARRSLEAMGGDVVDVQRFAAAATARYLGSRGKAALWHDFSAWQRFIQLGGDVLVEVDPHASSAQLRVRVLTQDRPSLLADLASALTSEGMNILHLHADTHDDNTALDAFVVEPKSGGRAPASIQQALQEALVRAARSGIRRPHRTAPAPPLDVATKVRLFDNADLWGSTIVEVRTLDRPGVLADIATVFAEHGWQVLLAMVSTEGMLARDTFYIRRNDDDKDDGTDEDAGHTLLKALQSILQSPA